MGAVAVTEQAITPTKHTPEDYKCPTGPRRDDENTQAAGAYVAFKKVYTNGLGPRT